MNPFIKPIESYIRAYDIVPTYVADSAKYLALHTGKPLHECAEYVKREIGKGGRFELQIPEALVLEKNAEGDRVAKSVRIDRYLEGVMSAGEILSPSLAAYTNPEKKESLLARYISKNLSRRKKAKAEQFAAIAAGDKLAEAIKEATQTTFKIKNNSLSGAHCSPYTVLWNKSAHSTLTSTCRTATSYGNAVNERFLFGNRHYWAPDIVKTNIVSIVNHVDLRAVEETMRTFQLHTPTVAETMALITRSTDVYWRSARENEQILALVETLSPLERAAFVYTGDFFHLALLNPEFCRKFLDDLSTKQTSLPEQLEVATVVKSMDDALTAFTSILCASYLKGLPISKMEPGSSALKAVAATAVNVEECIAKHELLIRTFWTTDNLPASIYHIPGMVRRGVITSDTDSTIFTVMYWTEWFVGKVDFTEKSTAIAATMVYLASKLIPHVLATVSGNMGVAKKDVMRLSMKNEFSFPTFVTTSRAKHYFAYISAREGNVLKELKTEIKGVALRSSNAPPFVIAKANEMMRQVMDTIMRGDKISIVSILKEIAALEQMIMDDISSGSYKLLPKSSVKGAASYKNPESSNFVHYGMWEEVFAVKYGHAPEPPYTAIKVSLGADSPSKIKRAIASIEDVALRDRFQNWIDSSGRKSLEMLLLPEPILAMTGVPVELIANIDVRGLISQTMESFYLLLESLGIFMKNDNITRLVSDTQWLLEQNK